MPPLPWDFVSFINIGGLIDYADLKGKPFFPGLIKYMASGPVVGMVWQGLDAVKTGRSMLGATNPLASAPGMYQAVLLEVDALIVTYKVPSVVTSHLPSAATFATAPTLSKTLRRRSSCKQLSGTCPYVLPHAQSRSWFPEGIVQYTSVLNDWIHE